VFGWSRHNECVTIGSDDIAEVGANVEADGASRIVVTGTPLESQMYIVTLPASDATSSSVGAPAT
jgi:hypothetical protein